MKFELFNLSLTVVLLVTGFVIGPALAAGPFPFRQVADATQVIIHPGIQQQQPDDLPAEEQEKQDDTKKEVTSEEQGEVTDTATLKKAKTDVSDKYIRFHMWDGSIVAGEIQVDFISVRTEFGTLQIPIRRIKKLYPGLNSFPELNSKIMRLVEDLGDKDFDVREKANRALTAMGMQIRHEIDNFEDGGSAERKKRLATIKKGIDEALDEFEEEDESIAQRALIRGDMVETPEFSVVGKIEQEQFTLESKFGQLSVRLSDIKMAERSFDEKPEEIRKNVSVDAEAFFQRTPVSTRIRVNKGDKISVRADGVVQWTNWSSSSTPDGLPNQGMYQGMQSGTLCARIGSSGKVVKLGTTGDLVASKSGILYLGVAMQDSYLANNGYKWTGNYNAKIHVKPVESD